MGCRYRFASLIASLAILSAVSPSLLSQTQSEPTLVAAELITHTRGDNKDHDTGIYVTVTTKDGASLLAQISNADSSGTDATEYNDNSSHIVRLVVENDEAKKSDCNGFGVRIAIQTNGNDTWLFDAQVILYFSDGTDLFAEQRNIALVNNHAEVIFSATEAAATSGEAEPTLVRAELITHTNGDNKDHDTGIYATLTTKDGASLLAQILNADSSGTDATAYNDNSSNTVKLVTESVGAKKSDCTGFNVRIAIQTNGNDTWIFDAAVVLYFSDGTDLFAEQRNIALVNNRAEVIFSAPVGGTNVSWREKGCWLRHRGSCRAD